MSRMTTDSNFKLAEEKDKLSRLVFNATEINGKVKGWRVIQDTVRDILVTPVESHIVENKEVQLAFAILPLVGFPDLSYAQLQAVVQKFHANAKADKPLPAVNAGLADGARKAQAPQANLQAMPVGSTTEKIPTAKTRGDAGIILQDIDMPFSGSSQMSVTEPFSESWSGIAGARKGSSTTYEKRKQILESSSGEEGDPADPDFNQQEFGKRRRTKPNSAIQRAVVPCGQCILDEIECFKFAKPPRGRMIRVCAHCKEKRRHCSFIPRPSRKNKEPSWKTLYAVADDSDETQFSWFPSGSSSSRVKQESSLGDVTTRVIKVEDMVMGLQDQFKTIQEKVVVMDTRIEDLFEGTKSVARVMKGFETRSEQANRIIEKLVERVERVESL